MNDDIDIPLPDPDVHDLAVSFIEEEVGRHDFTNNWRSNRGEDALSRWLVMRNEQSRFGAVRAEVDRLCDEGTGWIR